MDKCPFCDGAKDIVYKPSDAPNSYHDRQWQVVHCPVCNGTGLKTAPSEDISALVVRLLGNLYPDLPSQPERIVYEIALRLKDDKRQ